MKNEINYMRNFYLCMNYLYWYFLFKKNKKNEVNKYFSQYNFKLDVWILEILSKKIDFWIFEQEILKNEFNKYNKNKSKSWIVVNYDDLWKWFSKAFTKNIDNIFILLFLWVENFKTKIFYSNKNTIELSWKHQDSVFSIVDFLIQVDKYLKTKTEKEQIKIFNDYYLLFFQIYFIFNKFFTNYKYIWNDIIFQHWLQFIKNFFEIYWWYITNNEIYNIVLKNHQHTMFTIYTKPQIVTKTTKDVLHKFIHTIFWNITYYNLRFWNQSIEDVKENYSISQEIKNLENFTKKLKWFDEENIWNSLFFLDNVTCDSLFCIDHFVFDMKLDDYKNYLNIYKNHLFDLKTIWKKIFSWYEKLNIIKNDKINFTWWQSILFIIKREYKENYLCEFLTFFFKNYYHFITFSLNFFHNLNIINFITENKLEKKIIWFQKIKKHFIEEKEFFIRSILNQIDNLNKLIENNETRNLLYEYDLNTYKQVLLHLKEEIEKF